MGGGNEADCVLSRVLPMQTVNVMEEAMKNWRNIVQSVSGAVLLAAVLAAAFMAYLRPAFVVDLANRFILCS